MGMMPDQFSSAATKISHILAGVLAAAVMPAGFTLAGATPAMAASATCTVTFSYNGVTSTITNVSCSGGAQASPWVRYYANDNTTKVSKKNGAWISSGSSSVSRPPGSFAYSGGFQVG
jgi:hypothetical protein